MSDQFFWYVTRSAALITWLTSAASILVGLMTSSRVLGRRPTIPWLVDLHRMFAAMTMTFLAIHMVSLWLDSFVRFRFDDLLIPWVADVPGLTKSSIAYGVIAAWLVAAVQLTSLVKDRMAERLWRSIHLLSFVVLGLGTLHAIQAGSDIDNPIVLGLGVSVLTAVLLATVMRVLRYRQQRNHQVVVDDERPVRRDPRAPVGASMGSPQQHHQPASQPPSYEQFQPQQYPQPRHEPQYEQPQYQQPQYAQPKYQQPDYPQPGYQQPGHQQQPQYQQPEYQQLQYQQAEYSQELQSPPQAPPAQHHEPVAHPEQTPPPQARSLPPLQVPDGWPPDQRHPDGDRPDQPPRR
jgi:DMSO/TMAO reductase YedYZ heme-binding membrane subunit